MIVRMSSITSPPETIVAFTVPYLTPPSVNHAYQPTIKAGKDGAFHRGRKLSPDAKAFKDAVAIFSRQRTVAPTRPADLRKARYRVEVHLYLGKNVRLDPDNCGKIAVDALKDAGVIHADHNVEFKAIPHRDWENPRTEYIVELLEPK
jgi:hypothetical protein